MKNQTFSERDLKDTFWELLYFHHVSYPCQFSGLQHCKRSEKRWTDEESDFLIERFKGYILGINISIHQSELQEAQRKCLPRILSQIRSTLNNIKLGK